MVVIRQIKQRECLAQKKFVMAFTYADDDRWLPPHFVVGQLTGFYVATLDYGQYFVDGVGGIDKATMATISKPTPELIQRLKKKSRDWQRQDEAIAKQRARKDNTFRDKKISEDGIDDVREDLWDAFCDFCGKMRKEDQRLVAKRRSEAMQLIKEFKKKVCPAVRKACTQPLICVRRKTGQRDL